MTAAIRGLENLARTAQNIGDIGATQLQGQQYLTDQKMKSMQMPHLALQGAQAQATLEKLRQPVRMTDYARDTESVSWFASKGPLGKDGITLFDKIAQTVGAEWDKNPDSPTNGMMIKDGRPLTNMDILPYRGEIANWAIAYTDPDHIHADQIERYTRAAETNPEMKQKYIGERSKAQEWFASPERRVQSYRKQQAILLGSPLSTTPETQAQVARLDNKVAQQQKVMQDKINAMKPDKDAYDMQTIYGPKGKTARVSVAKGSNYVPPKGWSLDKPSDKEVRLSPSEQAEKEALLKDYSNNNIIKRQFKAGYDEMMGQTKYKQEDYDQADTENKEILKKLKELGVTYDKNSLADQLIAEGKEMQGEGGLKTYLTKYGVSNPDDPRHNYDYRAAYEAGVKPTLWDDLPKADKEEDIWQAMTGERTGEKMPREKAIKLYSGHYMWPDKFKGSGHRIPSKNNATTKIDPLGIR